MKTPMLNSRSSLTMSLMLLCGNTALGQVGFTVDSGIGVGEMREESVPRRSLARYDFEENERFPTELPVGWSRVLARALAAPASGTKAPIGAPDLPEFGSVRAEHGAGRDTSRWGMRFTVNGASMAIASEPSRIPLGVGAQVVVTAWARTKDLKNASTRVSCQFCDATGKPIGPTHTSELIRSESDWRQLRVAPPAAPIGTVGLSLWLEVVQPRSLKADEDTRFTVTHLDVSGSAIFDDIEVWQLPTVAFEAGGLGIVAPGAITRLALSCNDPSSAATTVTVRVRDASDITVHTATLEVPPDRALTMNIPTLPTGWYEAEARFSSGNEAIAMRRARFAVLPNDPFEPDEPPRFGVSLGSSNMPVAPALDLARAAFVVLPIWEVSTDTRETKHVVNELRAKVSSLLDRRVEPMFRIAAVPATLAHDLHIDSADTLALFALEENRWRPALEPWLLAFGQQVDQWFIGNDAIEGTRADLPQRVEALSQALQASIAGPSIGVPWSPSEELSPQLASTLDAGRHTLELVVDPAWRESAGELYEGLPTGPRGMVRIIPLPAGRVEDRERAVDLAMRAIDAWRAGFDNISVDVSSDTLPLIAGPALELAAWRQISTRLCGRRFLAEIPVQEGVRALLADGPRGPVLVMWNEGAATDASFSIDLGTTAITATDLWGRSTRVEASASGHALSLGRAPLFVEGVSREMCMLRRGIRFDPPFAVARRAVQEGALVLANPWNTPMSGTVTIRDISVGTASGQQGNHERSASALGLTPRTHRFTIPALGEARMPVSFSVPRSLASGAVRVLVDVEATADEPFRATIEAVLDIGFRDITMESSWRLARSIESGSIDLVLTLKVTNVSQKPVDCEAFAVADGFAQSKKPISGLAPGATAVRVFHFADGVRKLSGRDIRAGVHDADADARLLKRIPIPPLLPPVETFAGASTDASR